MEAKLHGCQHCLYRLKTQEEAVVLLRGLIRAAHMSEIAGGGTLIEAHLSEDVVTQMCLWEEGCSDCESSHDADEISTERDSQYG